MVYEYLEKVIDQNIEKKRILTYFFKDKFIQLLRQFLPEAVKQGFADHFSHF